jgi:membrane fusion protein (multidrug efflux system)
MKRSFYLLIATIVLASCGGGDKAGNKEEQLAKLKKQRTEIEAQIKKLEAEVPAKAGKATPVSVLAVQPENFTGYVEVQSQITGDQDVNATTQAPGVIRDILVHPGQHVSKGQVLAVLDADAAEQSVKALEPQLVLYKQLYEKQQRLWAQNIGSEVQLLQAKAQYEALLKQKAAAVAQREMYTIKSPISGTVDRVDIKVGDAVSAGGAGIKVVNFDKLKAKANLGENYLGRVQQGNPVTLILLDLDDSIQTKLSYVSKSIDPQSRAFNVEINLGSNKKLHPNMSARMKIANYSNSNALVVPVSVIQKTAEGEMLYIAEGNKAKSVIVKTGVNANGMVEVLSGLNAGDKVITEGFEELDNGAPVQVK